MGGASRPGQRTRTGDRSGWLARALDRLPVPDLAAGQGTAPAGGHRRDRLPAHPTRLVPAPVNVRGHRPSVQAVGNRLARPAGPGPIARPAAPLLAVATVAGLACGCSAGSHPAAPA